MSFNPNNYTDKYMRNNPKSDVELEYADMRARTEVEKFLSRYDGETAFQGRLAKAFVDYLASRAKEASDEESYH